MNKSDLRKAVDDLNTLLSKLEAGELSIRELEELTRIAGTVYERTIMLKFQAYVNMKKPDIIETAVRAATDIELDQVSDEYGDESLPEPEPDETSFDFSLFEEDSEEAELEAPSIIEEVVNQEIPVQEPIKTTDRQQAPLFEDNSLASRLAGSKLNTLVGAFGLNERLRFINNLFDGSSEAFAEAIKQLDVQDTRVEAIEHLNGLMGRYSWDPEDECFIEFLTFVNRRYA